MKKTAFILALCLLASAAAACSGGNDNTADTADSAVSDISGEEITAETEAVPDIPEDVDFDGAEFKSLLPEWSLYTTYYFTDEENGDTVNDTIYERSRVVEEQLNIDIGYTCEGMIYDTRDHFANLMLAGEDVYDLYFTHNSTSLASYVNERYVQDWNTIPYIDMDKPYWSQSSRQSMEFEGILPLVSSSLIIPDINSLFYNKTMHENYSLESVEAIIDSGLWTWDKLAEMSHKVVADLNGDGVMNDQDQYGYLGEFGWQFGSITTSCGHFLIKKDSDGVPQLNLDTERMAGIVDKMYSFLKESGSAFTWKYSIATDPNAGGKPPVSFDSGRGLFYMVPLSLAGYFRTTEVDFGIIPLPKYDEAQEDYLSLNWGGFIAVPVTALDTDMIGMTVELLSYYNEKLVMPVFYDVLLGQKIARDEESIRMLDIIFDNAVYDLGVNLGVFKFMHQVIENGGDHASYYAANESQYAKYVSDYTDAFYAFMD